MDLAAQQAQSTVSTIVLLRRTCSDVTVSGERKLKLDETD